MNKIKLTICEEAEYAEKLSLYIRENEESGITVTWCAEKSKLSEHLQQTDMLLLGEAFQENIEDIIRITGKKLIVLLAGDTVKKACHSYPVIAKYQPAREIIRYIYGCAAEQLQDETVGWETSKEHLAIYAPWNSELSMMFGITLAQILSTNNRLLYISLQESLGMEQIIGMQTEDGLEDLVSYLRHFPPNLGEEDFPPGNANTGARLRSLCQTVGKADFVAPPKNPQNIYEVTEADYQRLFTTVEEQAAQRQIIWEFGPTLAGMFRWMNHCQEIFCPYQDEVLHQRRREQLEQIMERISSPSYYRSFVISNCRRYTGCREKPRMFPSFYMEHLEIPSESR